LVIREVLYRKLNFALGVVSVSVAAGCFVAQLALLRQYDAETERLVAAKEEQTEQMMRKLEDDARKITVKMGFNVLVLPEGQTVNDLYDDQVESKTMPEEYGQRLANSRVATINHVLPSLTQRVKWPERQRRVILMGVRGEVYVQSADQKPILEAVPFGCMVLGSDLHRSMKIKAGDKILFMGRELTVSKLHEERGSRDDETIWVNLADAQQLLNKPGLINAILALECNCQPDRLARIRSEIAGLLPGTHVIEFASQAIARSEIRLRTAAEARASVDREKASRLQLRGQREAFAAILVPIVILASGLWIAFLAFSNVRDRAGEVGILRAVGVRFWQIVALFLGRAVAIGVVGAILGVAAGLAVVALRQGIPTWHDLAQLLESPGPFLAVLLSTPVLAALASWLPAFLAAQQDPAAVLQQE
jgi:hypothetical protein